MNKKPLSNMSGFFMPDDGGSLTCDHYGQNRPRLSQYYGRTR